MLSISLDLSLHLFSLSVPLVSPRSRTESLFCLDTSVSSPLPHHGPCSFVSASLPSLFSPYPILYCLCIWSLPPFSYLILPSFPSLFCLSDFLSPSICFSCLTHLASLSLPQHSFSFSSFPLAPSLSPVFFFQCILLPTLLLLSSLASSSYPSISAHPPWSLMTSASAGSWFQPAEGLLGYFIS